MKNTQVAVAPTLNKISEVIDKDGNKLDKIGKGAKIIAKKKVFNMADLEAEAKEEVKVIPLATKIEQKINDKINEMLDKKIDEIFSKMF